MLALGVHYATYCAEVYRAGIESIPKGQFEAAKVIGLSARDTYWRVVLPQAVPPVILPLGNYFVSMLKETPLLLAITIVEVVAAARIIGSETFRYTEPMTIAGIIFLIYSLLFSYAARGIDLAVKRKWY
jgi:polar amino acid transport system permease protein